MIPSNLMTRIDQTNAVLLATTLALSAGAIFIFSLAMSRASLVRTKAPAVALAIRI